MHCTAAFLNSSDMSSRQRTDSVGCQVFTLTPACNTSRGKLVVRRFSVAVYTAQRHILINAAAQVGFGESGVGTGQLGTFDPQQFQILQNLGVGDAAGLFFP